MALACRRVLMELLELADVSQLTGPSAVDGSENIWFAGQYANQFQGVNTPPAFGRNWGTWIGAIPAS